jgi:hypothetical protein
MVRCLYCVLLNVWKVLCSTVEQMRLYWYLATLNYFHAKDRNKARARTKTTIRLISQSFFYQLQYPVVRSLSLYTSNYLRWILNNMSANQHHRNFIEALLSATITAPMERLRWVSNCGTTIKLPCEIRCIVVNVLLVPNQNVIE